MNKIISFKKSNKGFSLVELLVTFAILSVVGLAVGGFAIASMNSYKKVNAETNVQTEAQISLNQIENLVIDAGLGVNYNLLTADGVNQWVLNDAGNGLKADDGSTDGLSLQRAAYKVLYVFNYEKTVDDEGTERQQVKVLIAAYDVENKKLYYTEVAAPNSDTTSIAGLVTPGNIPTWDILAEEIEAFSVDLTEYEETNRVGIALTATRSGQSYSTAGTITLRNTIAVNELAIANIYKRIQREKERYCI